MKEAMFWEAGEDGKVRCGLCHHRCLIAPGARGLCEVRENRDGRLVSLVYGHPVAKAVDPVEKKPLSHVLPGSRAFSIGTVGCNFRCLHCQNCSLSQAPAHADECLPLMTPPETIVSQARASGCRSIAYTYNEPTIFFEYAYDIARLARAAGLKNLFVTNGYITPVALDTLAPVLDAANIDLKFFSDQRYREVAGARLQPVLDMIRLYHASGIWIEITTLIIPGYNDDSAQLRGIAGFIAGVDPGIPWHVTAFRPAFRLLDIRPTSQPDLDKAEVIGREAGLKYVYPGNLGGSANTVCPECGALLLVRQDMRVQSQHLEGGQCPRCGTAVGGIWA